MVKKTSVSNNLENKIEANCKNLDRAISWVSVADNKAKFILSIELVILGFLMTQAKFIFTIIITFWQSKHILKIIGGAGLSIIFALYILFAIISIINLIKVISPKRKPFTDKKSLFYYQTIADISSTDFKNRMKNITDEEILEELSVQTFNISKVVVKKFDEIQSSIKWLSASFVLWLIMLIIIAIYRGFYPRG